MSTLMFWNKQNAANQNNETKNGKRNWLHAPDALLNGHVVYLVKFFGNAPVEQAKGIEVVKDAIRRLQFAQQMKKAETGNNPKTKKVEITISVDGVAIQEPRTQKILHQFPLHNISYCADEKGVKKFFSFIAKNIQPQTNGTGSTIANTNGHTTPSSTTVNNEEGHECFVFISSKLASDITLTIGQAFDLAYRRFVNENGKTTELAKIQTQNKQLERTVAAYKNRLKQLSELVPKNDFEKMLSRLGIHDILEVPMENGLVENHVNGNKTSESESSNDDKLLIETSNKNFPPIIPPRNLQNQLNTTFEAFKPGSQKMEELLLNSDSDSDFDPRADENESGNKISNDLFGFEPPKTFGQQLFTNYNNNNQVNHNNNINNMNNNSITNGNSNNNANHMNGNLTNGLNGNVPQPTSPPPLLAPPPKAAIPRRSNANMNGTNSQDLFGSAPFNPNSTSIFDDKIGSDTYLNGKIQTNSISSGKSNNSIAFTDDNDPQNLFNESGVFDLNEESNKFSHQQQYNVVLPEITTLADNVNKLDGIIKTGPRFESGTLNGLTEDAGNNGTEKKLNPFSSSPSAHQSLFGNENLQKSQKEKSNPFKKAESFLTTRSTPNYDALRNSPEIEAMMQEIMHGKKNSKEENESEDSTKNKVTSGTNKNYDLFKDAASAAFSEFNGIINSNKTGKGITLGGFNGNSGGFSSNISTTSSTKHASNEFSNKMAGLSFTSSAQNNSNFGFREQSNFNSNKSLLVDDFSLESLDPLRK